MGRSPCCEKAHTNKGAWTKEEDQRLIDYIRAHGEGCWRSLPKAAGLLRCGKSCRLRWINYLRPDLKRGNFTEEEDELIIKLHSLLGNKWSLIAGRLPGRTDNEIKNYWNTHIKRKLLSRGFDPQTHRPLTSTAKSTAIPQLELDKLSLPAAMEFNDSSPPVAEITLVHPKLEVRSESVEEGNCNSGTTEEKDQQQQSGRKTEGEQLNLELSIGPIPVPSELTGISFANTAESKLHRVSHQLYETTPYGTAGVGQSVCLCCHLGLENSQSCSNCQVRNSGFYRYYNYRPLNS